jgi:hypothetical protein
MSEGSSSLFTWNDEAGVEHDLSVDVVSAAVDERTAVLSDHVVEDGSIVTDHIVIQPETLTLELAVTQTPLGPAEGFQRTNLELDVRPSQFVPGGFLALTSGVRGAITSLLGAADSKPTAVNVLKAAGNSPIDRVADAHDKLIRILQGGLLVTVNFKGRIYVDYALTRVTLTHNPGEFGMGRFSVDLRSFRTVTGEVVTLPDPADFYLEEKQSKGNKPPKPPNPDPAKVLPKSAPAALLDLATGAG